MSAWFPILKNSTNGGAASSADVAARPQLVEDSTMEVIRTKAELVELLFQELDESKPRQEVHPSFLLRVGGICHGLIYGGWDGVPPYLEDTFSTDFEYERPVTCGVRLVTFARSLAATGCFDPMQVWTLDRLIDLVLAALNSNDLKGRADATNGHRCLVSTPRFARRRGVRDRVRLGRAEGALSVAPSPRPA
jgi:hypothetical protein